VGATIERYLKKHGQLGPPWSVAQVESKDRAFREKDGSSFCGEEKAKPERTQEKKPEGKGERSRRRGQKEAHQRQQVPVWEKGGGKERHHSGIRRDVEGAGGQIFSTFFTL